MNEVVNYFVVRATNTEENDFIITCGNQQASVKHFKTAKAAQMYINSKPYELIATLCVVMWNAIKSEEQKNEENSESNNSDSKTDK